MKDMSILSGVSLDVTSSFRLFSFIRNIFGEAAHTLLCPEKIPHHENLIFKEENVCTD
jgi:hypothetical protein